MLICTWYGITCNLQSRGQQIKLVKQFKYLGYMITSDGKCITEIKKRIATAKDAFQKLSLIVKNRNISMKDICVIHVNLWVWVLDYKKRHREENRSSRNVVYQTNVKNLMDRKETQCKCIERGECAKTTVENNLEEASGIFRTCM